jgi:hypothetical protein
MIPLLLILSFTVFFCNSSVKSSVEVVTAMKDTLKRPVNVSKHATLINLGFEDLPVYMWVEYSGKLKQNGQTYPHIYEFQYFDKDGKLSHIEYYENMQIRSGNKDFDASQSKVLPFPGDATIQVSNGHDSLLFFHVLESEEFRRSYNGIEYIRMPTVYLETQYGNGTVSHEDVEFNIRKEMDFYTVTFTGSAIPFKLCSACKTEPTKVSFLNEQEGRIYFVEKECYLELVNSEDIMKIQALRR